MLKGMVVCEETHCGIDREEYFWRQYKTLGVGYFKEIVGMVKFIMGCLMEGLKVEKGRYLGDSGRKRSGKTEGRWDKKGQSTGNR